MKFLYRQTYLTLLSLALFVRPCLAEEIIVSAAASLTNAMTEVGKSFHGDHPEVDVIFNFASSGSLLQQMLHGAPVDVFASANQKYMDDAQEKGLVKEESRQDFVRNTLVLAVPADAETVLTVMEDLAGSAVARIALGNPESVPAGRYARESLQAYGLWDSLHDKFVYGNSVRQVLDYLRRGEVDAGLVYSTDAKIGGERVKVALEPGKHKEIIYPIAVIRSSEHVDAAQQFVDFVLSEKGQAIFTEFGFKSIQK